jgi:hypothetical protein
MKGGDYMIQTLNIRTMVVLAMAAIAILIMAGSAFAKNEGGTRPGWGYGDKNHEHTGPPGQSVRP